MSALRSSAGPAVCTNGTSSSAATICASEVLPSPGGPASSTWSSASPRLAAASIETPSCSRSASWPTNSSSRRGRSVASSRRRRARARSAAASPGRPRTRPGCGSGPGHRGLAQRRGDQVLGRVARRVAQQPVGLLRRVAEPEQRLARERARVVPARDHDRVLGGGHADLLAQLHDDPLGRALADPGHRLQARGVAGGDGGEQLARRPAREHGQRHLRPDRLHAEQQQEQVALLLGGEAVEQQRVVAHDQVGGQRRLLAHARDVAQRLRRHVEAVADAAAGDHHVIGRAAPRPRRRRARSRSRFQRCGHRRPVGVADRDGERVGRVVGPRQLLAAPAASGPSAEPGPWPARPEPQTAALTC